MEYLDDHDREMAKWSHHRVTTASHEAEEAQRQALSEDSFGL
ncbi:MAG TPA: hypothetical protein VHT50_17645 [Mycobacterium sp.]|nr:hypothetical protein [Mycobacterium sp.]